jgi:hypothetical protein
MTTISMAAQEVARERQLDWLLGEVLGGGAAARSRAPSKAFPWLAAAIAVLAVGVAIGVAALRGVPGDEAQDPPVPSFHECHGVGDLEHVPADVTALKCFDFDDAACAQLAKFTKLEQLDLSGTDVNDKGYSLPPQVTDAGVRALAPLTSLRWLSLATCHDLKGEGLQALEALPRLEHLDLTYSGVTSPAIERLPRLPSLRTLVLSHCMSFHGRSLAAVATIPGLRRLELRACTTLAAKDVLTLVQSKQLRHLDLRDCQGRFRGQTIATLDDVTGLGDEEKPPPPPVQDAIGITDAVVAALAALPLETLLLGGCESLTDAIGDSLAKMTSLRSLDLANLPKITGATLARVPPTLESLALDRSEQLTAAALHQLPALPRLTELGLCSLPELDDATLQHLLAGKQLRVLRLGGLSAEGKGGRGAQLPSDPRLTAAAIDAVVAQRDLEVLHLDRNATWARDAGLDRLTELPQLRELDFTLARHLGDEDIAKLAGCRSLHKLKLGWCQQISGRTLAALATVPLRDLDLYATKCDPASVRKVAADHWPGCRVVQANGLRYRAP